MILRPSAAEWTLPVPSTVISGTFSRVNFSLIALPIPFSMMPACSKLRSPRYATIAPSRAQGMPSTPASRIREVSVVKPRPS